LAQQEMNRRMFLSRLSLLIALAGTGKLAKLAEAGTRNSKGKDLPKIENVSLREIAEKKLHHCSHHFINPFNDLEYGSIWRLLKWKVFGTNHFKELYNNEKVTPVSLDLRDLGKPGDISVTFIKHSTVFINYLGTRIIVDPLFFGLFPFIKDFTPLQFSISDIPKPDIILITHGHYDHLDIPSMEKLPNDSTVVAPLGYNTLLKEAGFNRIVSLDWFETYSLGEIDITLLPCNHWTMRNLLAGPNRALWGSFLVRSASASPSIFISGDTGYFRGFKEIGNDFDIDLAIINLGAYEPRWFMAQSHLNPSEAGRAFLDLRAKRLMVVHWGTFRLGDEPVYLPPIKIAEEMEKLGSAERLVRIRHGETYHL